MPTRSPARLLPYAPILILMLLAASPKPAEEIAVYFSPKGGCTDAIVSQIDAARSSIAVQAYTFTSTPIAQALARAQRRGVKTLVVLDESNRTDEFSQLPFLLSHNIKTYLDKQHPIAHNKVMVIDQQTVITGSFNFTKMAEESNAENLLVIHKPELAAKYLDNFTEHLKHSEAQRK